jgi:CTP-dependent riboflavin kinase
MTATDSDWTIVHALIGRGHQVASGKGGDARFPGGTVRMQAPHFLSRGLDLSPYYSGTINVSIAPHRYKLLKPRVTFRNVKWHPTQPAEDFSFFDVRLFRDKEHPTEGLIYFPHPETKPEHFQQPDVLELLLPFVEGLELGNQLRIALRREQVLIE